MTEVKLLFADDGEIITVVLQDFIANEWQNDKKINGNLKKHGATIVSFKELGVKDREEELETTDTSGEEFLQKVDLDLFDVDVMPDGLRVLTTDDERIQKLEDHLFETDDDLKDLRAIRGIQGYTEFPDFDKE